MSAKEYIDREILLQVKRNWSDSEIITHLTNENKSLEFKVGELKSELDELKDKYENKIKEYRKDDYIKSLLKEIARQREKKNEYKKQMIDWRNKYYGEKNKV
jgi:pheromone shutdown protein TraB